MKRFAIIALFFVLAIACGRKDKGFMPERLLSEQEMIAIMTDVQIIEAGINQQKSQERERTFSDTVMFTAQDFAKLARNYYNQLFEHYDITDSIFAQNMRYYTERPAVLERIMDSVLQRLTKEQSISSAQQQSNH